MSEQKIGKWAKDLLKDIEKTTKDWKKSQKKKYTTDLLIRMIEKIDKLSKNNNTDKKTREDIKNMVEILPTLNKDKQNRKKYEILKKDVLRYFQLEHKMVLPNYYMFLGMVVGSFVGVIWYFGNIYVAVMWVLGLGILGGIFDYIMEKKNRVI